MRQAKPMGACMNTTTGGEIWTGKRMLGDQLLRAGMGQQLVSFAVDKLQK